MSIKIGLQELATCPGLHVALGWIIAAQDTEAILHLESLLLKQDEVTEKPSEFSAQHRHYFTRLRIGQMKEAIGLCRKTEQFPNLLSMIKCDKHGAFAAFERLLKLNVDGPKVNDDMRLVCDIRNSTFHYCLDECADWYAKTISDMLLRGERFIEIEEQRGFPDRFEPADQLFQNMFLTQLLGIEMTDLKMAGKRFSEVAQTLAQIGDDIGVVARSISQGLAEKYHVRSSANSTC